MNSLNKINPRHTILCKNYDSTSSPNRKFLYSKPLSSTTKLCDGLQIQPCRQGEGEGEGVSLAHFYYPAEFYQDISHRIVHIRRQKIDPIISKLFGRVSVVAYILRGRQRFR